MPKSVRISLANKCQLLFGAAVILIILAALVVVWFRMDKLVRERQRYTAQLVASAWFKQQIELLDFLPTSSGGSVTAFDQKMSLTLISKDQFDVASQRDPFLARVIKTFQTHRSATDAFTEQEDDRGQPTYLYVRAITKSQLDSGDYTPRIDIATLADPLEKVLIIRFWDDVAQRQRVLNTIYIVTAGLVAMLLAIGAFWYITTRIILSPVRVLRDTAEQIAQGDTNIRSDINTGDEFEQLSDMFNAMVSNLNAKEQQLRQTNKGLDLKLGELAEHNVALYEANRIKDEFLANVSHELRTPLHSIIGFAEVLEETLARRTGPIDEKRKRYIANIIVSSKRLLDLINDLLDLAKIEAGRIDLNIEPMSVADVAEGLVNLIRPQAEKCGIELKLDVQRDMPLVHTDAGKVQQIIFNFLSNAVKFTPPGPGSKVTLFARMLDPLMANHPPRLHIGVKDTGPGIPLDQHEKIFDKFTQLDATVTREHGGTGLGLTISRDLAKLLQGEIEVDSDHGKGATFSLTIPWQLESRSVPLMPGHIDE